MLMNVVLIIHLVITVSLVGMVLLQRSEGGGLGMGGGGGFMTTRGSANAMTHMTVFLAVAFFTTSISLSILAGMLRVGNDFEVDAGAPAGVELLPFPSDAPVEEQSPQIPSGD